MLRKHEWNAAKAKLQHYGRREPERSDLYRLVYGLRDELPRAWEERYQPTYGVLRDEVLDTLDAYLNCGLLCHGAARVYCDACNTSRLVAFSCKKRGVCPSCLAKRAVMFAEHLYEEIIKDVPCRHIVFTIPKRIRVFLKYDRTLNDILFKAAWGSIKEVLAPMQGTPAAALELQSAGDAMRWHPHLHGILADGLYLPDGSLKPFDSIDTETLTRAFAEKVLSALHEKELISDDVVTQILSQEHSGFTVWIGDPFSDPESKKFVARYIERGPLSLEKLSIRGDKVVYTSSKAEEKTFDPLDFLALMTSHIPLVYESLVRFYGWWSCRSRGERAKKEPAQTDIVQEGVDDNIPGEPPTKPSSAWAACIKRIYEVDPMECPKCGAAMRIISFIHDPPELKKLMDALGLPHFKAPKKLACSQSLEDFALDAA